MAMAVSNSPDCSVGCITIHHTPNKQPHKQPTFFYSSCKKKTPFVSIIVSSNSGRNFSRTKSSSCSSPPSLVADPVLGVGGVHLNLNPQDVLVEKSSTIPRNYKEEEEEDMNDVIHSLFKDPNTEDHISYDYYETKAKKNPEFVPRKETMSLLLRYLHHTKNWNLLFKLSEDMKSFQLFPDAPTLSRVISTCVRSRKFRLVNVLVQIVLGDEQLCVLAFDSAIRGYNKLHMYSSTIALYDRISRSSGIDLNEECVYHVMEAYLKTRSYEKVVTLFRLHGIKNNKKIYWMLCEALGKMGRCFEALEYFREMTNRGIAEDHLFYSSLICSFASVHQVELAEELLAEAEGKGMLRDPALFMKLVLMYVHEGRMEKTLDVVSVMHRAKIRISDCIFCAIVNGFCKKRGLSAAVKAYEDLRGQGCEPGQVTYASIQSVYCRLGLYSKAEEAFVEMEEKGFDKCVVAYCTMVAMYGKTGRLREATRLVAKMKERGCQPNVWIYNSLLDMHGKVLNLRQVEKTWKEMKRRKILPDRISYTSVISAYSRAREFEKCMGYYREFRLNGGRIDRAMAGIMVSVFSKGNHVDELVKLLQDLKSQGTKLDARLFRSAMNALRDTGLQLQAKWLQESFGPV